MARIRKIRKIGNSYFIPLSYIDMKDLGLEEGYKIDISDIVNQKPEEDDKQNDL